MTERNLEMKPQGSFEEMMELVKKYPIKPKSIQFHPQEQRECGEA